MPSIKDQSTVNAIARIFCGEAKRNKAETLRIVGYQDSYCDNRGTGIVYTNERVIAAIAKIDAKAVKKADLTIQSVLENIDWGIKKARATNDLPALARLSELQGKYLSMWSEQGNNAAEGLNLNFTTKTGSNGVIAKIG